LSIATNQRLLFDQAVAYQAETPIGGIQQGPLLCYCCLVIFGLMMFNEIQDALHHLLGVWSLKRAGETVIVWEEEKCSIVSISLGRAILGTVGDLLRLASAGVLYFYGSQWLVYTTGLGDLLVNSAVLGFLLDLQAQIFELGSSHRLRLTIECMEPMKITPFPGKTLLPLVLFFGLLVSTLIMGNNWMRPMVDQMTTTMAVICGSNLNFATSVLSDVGVHWTTASHFQPHITTRGRGKYIAVDTLVKHLDPNNIYTTEVKGINDC
jgi:hypothetical protein